MIVEGAWIIVVAGAVITATITLVLVSSGRLYNPDRSHEWSGTSPAACRAVQSCVPSVWTASCRLA